MQLIKYIIMFLPTILVLSLFILGLITKYKDIKDFILFIPFSIVITAFFNAFLFLALTETNSEVVSHENIKYNLISTKFSNTIDGNFFLGTGTIDNEEYMYYIIRDEDEIQRKKTQNYKIYITDGKPYVLIERNVVKESTTNWLYNTNDIEEKVVEGVCTFYIPENSIVQNININ